MEISEKARQLIMDFSVAHGLKVMMQDSEFTESLFKEAGSLLKNYIASLEAGLDEQKTARQWTSVNECMPTNGKRVLVMWKNELDIEVIRYIGGTRADGSQTEWTFKYWMPLPEAPEVK